MSRIIRHGGSLLTGDQDILVMVECDGPACNHVFLNRYPSTDSIPLDDMTAWVVEALNDQARNHGWWIDLDERSDQAMCPDCVKLAVSEYLKVWI